MNSILYVIFFGLVSGVFGTIVMTLSQLIEIALTKRKPSLTPAIAVSNLFRFDLEKFKEGNKWRFNNLVHWSYGLLWGVLLATVYTALSLEMPFAILAYFLIFWIQALIILPILRASPPVWQWEAKWIILDLWHHFIYAIVAVSVYYWINLVV